MTPLEIIGITSLGYFGMKLLARAFFRSSTTMVTLQDAAKQCNLAVRDGFQAGFMCAADMVTHNGHEELAGQLRKVAQGVKEANDN